MKRLIPIAVTGALIASLFLACNKSSKDIIIGTIAPFTGDGASYGQSTKKAIDLAVADWNAKGGLLGKQIKVIYADDKSDPAEGVTVATKLVEQDKAVAILGPVVSKVALAACPIWQEHKIPVMATSATNAKVTQVGDYIYRACFIDPFQGTVGAKFAYDDLKVRKAACLFDLGNDYAKGLAETFKAKFTSMGGEVVAFEGHATGTADFNAQLVKILSAKPDLLYLSDFYNDVALIAKQARELGYKGPMLGGDGWDSPKLVEIGGPAVEGCFFTNHYSSADTRPVVQEFVKKFQDKYQEPPDAFAMLSYDGAYLMFDAIQRAGTTDGPAVRDALKTTNLAVVSGQLKFDENRNPVKSAVIIEIKGGKQVFRASVNP